MISSEVEAALERTTGDRETTVRGVRLCDIVDKFLNQHCLADTGTPEKANLASASVGSEEVYNFNTGLEDFGRMGSDLEG